MSLLFALTVKAQSTQEIYQPRFVAKTNALYWATVSPNLGFEIGLSRKLTLDVSGNYDPIKLSSDKYLKHWLVQPELRYWFCGRFSGHFMGVHGHFADFNEDGLTYFNMKGKHRQGYLYGGGVSYGYSWILSNRWSLEATVGVGYAHVRYKKRRCETCDRKSRNYLGPTKVGLNFIYVFK